MTPGYEVQRRHVEQAWFVPIRRLRAFQFGRHGRILERSQPLDIPSRPVIEPNETCALAGDRRPFDVLKRLQGLPQDFELLGFSDEGRRRAVGNGVGLVLGRVVAQAVVAALGMSQSDRGPDTLQGELSHGEQSGASQIDAGRVTLPRCAVCLGPISGKAITCSDACRKTKSLAARKALKRRGGAL